MVLISLQTGLITMDDNFIKTKKSLGQHWLVDRAILAEIANCAELTKDNTVLEIGPGLGTLTNELLKRAKNVIAVELDNNLASRLTSEIKSPNLEVFNQDFLSFDLSKMPAGYKVVANVPYYITSKIVQALMTAKNKPSIVVLLVQKEVAERLAAKPGDMSILAISAQVYSDVCLGVEVPRQYFTPPPKVDSQVVILKTKTKPSFEDEKTFFRVVKAGFSSKRKKLRSSFSGGLAISKLEAEEFLKRAQIDPNSRAEQLSIEDWIRLTKIVS